MEIFKKLRTASLNSKFTGSYKKVLFVKIKNVNKEDIDTVVKGVLNPNFQPFSFELKKK